MLILVALLRLLYITLARVFQRQAGQSLEEGEVFGTISKTSRSKIDDLGLGQMV